MIDKEQFIFAGSVFTHIQKGVDTNMNLSVWSVTECQVSDFLGVFVYFSALIIWSIEAKITNKRQVILNNKQDVAPEMLNPCDGNINMPVQARFL